MDATLAAVSAALGGVGLGVALMMAMYDWEGNGASPPRAISREACWLLLFSAVWVTSVVGAT